MMLLKFFLSITLTVCIAWALLIFSGSSLIKYFFKVYVGEHVQLENISVSPRLEVNIGFVKYYQDIGAPKPVLKGSSRAVTVDFSFFSSQAPIVISVGPTNVEDIVRFENLTITIEQESLFRWDEAALTLEAQNLGVSQHSYIDQVKAVGLISDDFRFIEDISFSLKNFSSVIHSDIFIEDAIGNLDRMNIWENVKSQKNIFSIRSVNDGIQIRKPNLLLDFFGLELVNDGGVLDIAVEANEATFLDLNTHWHGISTEFKYDLNVDQLLTPVQIWMSDGRLGDQAAELSSVFTNFVKTEQGFNLNVLIDFKGLELSNGDFFLGKLDSGDLKWSIVYTGSDLSGTGNLHINSVPKLSVEINHMVMNFDLNEYLAQSLECSSWQCLNISPKFQFKGAIGGSFFSGELFCSNSDCSAAGSNYKTEVSDPEGFLLNLSKANILNPLLFAVLYKYIPQNK